MEKENIKKINELKESIKYYQTEQKKIECFTEKLWSIINRTRDFEMTTIILKMVSFIKETELQEINKRDLWQFLTLEKTKIEYIINDLKQKFEELKNE